MIDLSDRIRLPEDVRLAGDAIEDHAFGESYDLGGSASSGLALLLAGSTVRQAAEEVARRSGADPEVAAADLAQFVSRLSRAQLVNVSTTSVAARFRLGLYRALFIMVGHRWPPLRRMRHAIPAAGAMAIFGRITAVVSLRLLPAWLLAGTAFVLPGLLFAPRLTVAFAAILPGLVASIAAHETAHAVALRRAGVGCFLAQAGWRLAVVHPAGKGGAVADASGPALCGLTGMMALVLASVLHSVPLAFAATPFVVQLLGLTIVARDGRLLASRSGR